MDEFLVRATAWRSVWQPVKKAATWARANFTAAEPTRQGAKGQGRQRRCGLRSPVIPGNKKSPHAWETRGCRRYSGGIPFCFRLGGPRRPIPLPALVRRRAPTRTGMRLRAWICRSVPGTAPVPPPRTRPRESSDRCDQRLRRSRSRRRPGLVAGGPGLHRGRLPPAAALDLGLNPQDYPRW